MTTLNFVGRDNRWLLETLVEACEVTDREGVCPSVLVNGRTYSKNQLLLVALLLPEEELQPHHMVLIESIFEETPPCYRRAALKLANLANATASVARAQKFLAELRGKPKAGL
jgi:hypothetical protein